MTKSTPKKRPITRKTSKVTSKKPVKKLSFAVKGGLLAVVGLLLFLVVPLSAEAFKSGTVYDATPTSLPADVANIGFESTSTSELGDYIHLGGNGRTLGTVSMVMSTKAQYVDHAYDQRYTSNTSTWTLPVTITIYGNTLNEIYQPGPVIATLTQNIAVPWRPAADSTCANQTYWRAADGACYEGKAFTAVFDMSSLGATLPNDIIVSASFSTGQHGYSPLGLPGPYDTVGVGVPTNQTVAIGTDHGTDALYWNTTDPITSTTGGTVGLFNQNTGRAPQGTIAMKITTPVSMPGSKDECKKDGWKKYGTSFKNQGQCVSYREHEDDRDGSNRDDKKDNNKRDN
jgi:hypothetical protein